MKQWLIKVRWKLYWLRWRWRQRQARALYGLRES